MVTTIKEDDRVDDNDDDLNDDDDPSNCNCRRAPRIGVGGRGP